MNRPEVITQDGPAARLADLTRRWQRLQRAAWGTVALVVVLAAAWGTVALNRQGAQIRAQDKLITAQAAAIRRDERRLQSSCRWYHDVGSAPVSVNPATGQPSPLGVAIIVDARITFRGQGCPGRLSRPGRRLRKWARRFGLPPP